MGAYTLTGFSTAALAAISDTIKPSSVAHSQVETEASWIKWFALLQELVYFVGPKLVYFILGMSTRFIYFLVGLKNPKPTLKCHAR